MDYKYLNCNFEPCSLYTSADSEKCEYTEVFPTIQMTNLQVIPSQSTINNSTKLGMAVQRMSRSDTQESNDKQNMYMNYGIGILIFITIIGGIYLTCGKKKKK